jgi:hypothetical protein
MFGWARQVSVAGVKSALAQYGFDAVDITFGVATRSSHPSPSKELAASLATNRDYRDRLIADGATVLEGNLVERKSKTEEKQVDVLCAVKVCDLADRIATELHPAKCIVVLSEDMDLMPAYEFARERKVLAYAAAYDTIYQRGDQREWLILSEPALAKLVSPVGRYVGSELRSKLAAVATSTDERRSLSWTVHAPLSEGQFLMRGNLGAPGLWSPGRRVRPGDKASLYTAGVTVRVEDGGRFPNLLLQEDQPAAGPMPNVQSATVAYWQTPTSLKVNLGGDKLATVRATPGTLLPGQQVAVLQQRSGKDHATYLVGAIGTRPSVPGWSSAEPIETVVVSGSRATGAWLTGQVLSTGDVVLVHARHLDHASPTTKLRAFVTGSLESDGLPTTMPLTCCLP